MTTFCTKCSQPLLGGSPLCSNCGYDNAAGAFVEKPGTGGAHAPHPAHHEHPHFGSITPEEKKGAGSKVLIGVILVAVLGIVGYGLWSWNKSRLATTISWASLPTGGVGKVTSGFDFSCAITEDGKALCWGNSDGGQLGDTAAVRTGEPATVHSDAKFTQIEAGDAHACARDEGGNIVCWGSNARGQLGVATQMVCKSEHGQVPCSVFPVAAPVTGARAVAAGGAHTCALQADSNVTCWGSNLRGQLGTTDTQHGTDILVTHIDKRFHFISLAAGGSHTCGIEGDGSLMCWGWDRYGELGSTARMNQCVNMGATTPCAAAPVPAATSVKFMDVSLGRDHTCGVARDGTLWCWGANGRGQVGNGRTSDSVMAPVQPAASHRFTQVGAGQDFTCGLERDGSVWCWGDAAYHQLGTADSTFSATPVRVPLTTNALTLAVGGTHTCVVTVTKQVICWGADTQGQIGKGVVGLGDTFLREAGPTGAPRPVLTAQPAQPAKRS